MKKYPDMTRLFAAKETRRRKLANLPIEEKMEIAERLREMSRDAPGRRAVKVKTPRKKREQSTAEPDSWLKDLVRRKGEDAQRYEREVPGPVKELVENYLRVTNGDNF